MSLKSQIQPTSFIEIFESHIASWPTIVDTFENDLKDELQQWYGFVSFDFDDDTYYNAFP